MKLLELKHLLRVLTYICIVSLLLGCSIKSSLNVVDNTTPSLNNNIKGDFSAEYYILKTPDRNDYAVLEKYVSSGNLEDSLEAANILGYYNYRDGNIDLARDIFVSNYAKPGITQFIKTMNELWRMDLAITEGDYLGASVWARRVKRDSSNEETNRAMQVYCILHNISPEDEDYYSCVLKGMEVKNTEEYAFQPLLDSPLNILVVSSSNNAGGVLHYYTKHFDSDQGKDFKVRISKQYREGDWDFIIDLDNGYLSGRGYIIYFKPNISKSLEHMNDFIDLDSCENIIIGVGSGLYNSASALSGSINKSKVRILNLNPNSVSSIRNVLKDFEDKAFCAIAAGSEQEIDTFIPTVRQYILDSSNQIVFMVKTVDTGMYYTPVYLSYYGDSYVFPAINLNLEERMKEFSDNYTLATGKEISYDIVIGYDMMHFINSLTVHGSQIDESYLSGIIGFKDGEAIRETKGFYIDISGSAEELSIVKYSDEESSDDGEPEEISGVGIFEE